MKIVFGYGCGYGAYMVPEEVQKMIGCEKYDDSIKVRTDERFVNWVLTHKDILEDREIEIGVTTIPDSTTDIYIYDDGEGECIFYIVDGKIHLR